MSQLRVGGMAIVHGMKVCKENNGRVVTLVRPHCFNHPLTGESSPGWWVEGDLVNILGEPDTDGCMRAINLLPIDGGDFSHEINKEEELADG